MPTLTQVGLTELQPLAVKHSTLSQLLESRHSFVKLKSQRKKNNNRTP